MTSTNMSTVDSPHIRWAVLTLIVASCGLVFFNTNEHPRGSNVRSRYATIDSLVHRGTFIIDDSKYANTIDKAKLGEHFYSSKPPVLPTMAAGAYYVIHKLTGWNLDDDEEAVTLLVNLFVGLLPHLILLIYLSRFLRLWLSHEGAYLATLGVAGFAYLGAGYATDMNNHSPAAAAMFVAFYYAYVIRHSIADTWRSWLLCGLIAGLAPTLDLGIAVFCVGIFVYLATYDLRKTLTLFVPASLPFLTAHFVLTYVSTDSVLPIYIRGVGHYEGSYWNEPRGIDALSPPKHIYAFHALFGHHGLFAITPLFLLAIPALIRSFRVPERKAEALLVGLCTLAVVFYYIKRTHNYGGRCVGMRWFIFFMPLLLIYVGVWIEHVRRRVSAMALFAVLFFLSQYNTLDAMRRPFKHSEWHKLLIEEDIAKDITRREPPLDWLRPRGAVARSLEKPACPPQTSGKPCGS